MEGAQVTMELSEEMIEAIRILREDGIIENTRAAREANEALLARLDERDKKDEERWAKFEAGQKPVEALTPENDPKPVEGAPQAPPPVPVGTPVESGGKEKAKKRGLWFQSEEEPVSSGEGGEDK